MSKKHLVPNIPDAENPTIKEYVTLCIEIQIEQLEDIVNNQSTCNPKKILQSLQQIYRVLNKEEFADEEKTIEAIKRLKRKGTAGRKSGTLLKESKKSKIKEFFSLKGRRNYDAYLDWFMNQNPPLNDDLLADVSYYNKIKRH